MDDYTNPIIKEKFKKEFSCGVYPCESAENVLEVHVNGNRIGFLESEYSEDQQNEILNIVSNLYHACRDEMREVYNIGTEDGVKLLKNCIDQAKSDTEGEKKKKKK